jgi:hypothetical protein
MLEVVNIKILNGLELEGLYFMWVSFNSQFF